MSTNPPAQLPIVKLVAEHILVHLETTYDDLKMRIEKLEQEVKSLRAEKDSAISDFVEKHDIVIDKCCTCAEEYAHSVDYDDLYRRYIRCVDCDRTSCQQCDIMCDNMSYCRGCHPNPCAGSHN
jgi:hypothetical protein